MPKVSRPRDATEIMDAPTLHPSFLIDIGHSVGLGNSINKKPEHGSLANFWTASQPANSSGTLLKTNSQTNNANCIFNACSANRFPKHPRGPSPKASCGPAIELKDPSGRSQRSGSKVWISESSQRDESAAFEGFAPGERTQ
ncbi:hypothetical protein SNOG_03328 [Parastagonospora nodorum SN15]|uniref:Uncharacterized protein n=1 Tax=Phaeosphaeria nodorum (strain SN15 / ATCC MYA-4574 / FGSC 10173) TaxID=321614 RepID=Q0UY36_PHANO|nr:hypothetical protein SNOG_03328 [Parastagonospora nodorum SN15]EAT88533.1 hypothetical protein SNOG_03328 [Parastagonospora nodorum SN15]